MGRRKHCSRSSRRWRRRRRRRRRRKRRRGAAAVQVTAAVRNRKVKREKLKMGEGSLVEEGMTGERRGREMEKKAKSGETDPTVGTEMEAVIGETGREVGTEGRDQEAEIEGVIEMVKGTRIREESAAVREMLIKKEVEEKEVMKRKKAEEIEVQTER